MEDGSVDNIKRDEKGKPSVPIPYDFERHEPAPLRTKEDVIAFDKAFRSITADLPKPILLGSVMRLSADVLPNWGIQITKENRQDLRDYAEDFYVMDEARYTLENTARDMLQSYKRTLQAPCLEQMESSSSLILTNLLLSSQDKKKISICNLAAGAANVVRSVITKLGCDAAGKGILERTVFHLVDRPQKLERAMKNLGGLPANVEWHAKGSAEFLTDMKVAGKRFDYLVTVSQFHRKPFLSEYLKSIHDIMNERALLITADWHSPLTSCPSGVYDILETLNVPKTKLDYFRDLFGPFMHRDVRADNRPEENRALSDHIEYWKSLAGSMGSTDPNGLKIRIISAFLTQRQLASQLEKSGFDTDRDKIKTAFPRESVGALPSKLPVRIRSMSDTAVVSLAMRR
jgi:hypothetical protein